jgi:hypothetical protein
VALRLAVRHRDKVARLDAALIAAGLVVVFVLPTTSGPPSWHPGSALWHDGWVRYLVVDALAHHLPLDQVPSVLPGWSARWPLVATLTAMPLWFLGSLVGSPAWWIARYNALLFALGVAAAWLLLKDRVDRGLVRTFLLVLVAASMFPAHVVAFFGFEVFTAVLVGVGVLAVVTGRPKLGWAAVVLGVANAPASIVGLGLMALVWAWWTKRLRFLALPVPALVLILGDAWVRSGQLLPSYLAHDRGPRNPLPYSGLPGFSYPIAFGILSILFSFGKGLVFFTPGLFLPVRRALLAAKAELWSAYGLWVAFVVGLVLVYAPWRGWDGGFFFGPRFFLVASVPASLALAVRLHGGGSIPARLLTVAVLVLSVWVAVAGATSGMANLTRCDSSTGATDDYLCNYTLEYSALWHPFVEPEPLSARDVAFVALAGAVLVRLAGPVLYGVARDVGRLRRQRRAAAEERSWRL